MWTETGLTQAAGPIPPKGAGAERPREAEDESFGAVFDQPMTDVRQDLRSPASGEAFTASWQIRAPVPSVPVALSPDAGAAVSAGDGGLRIPDRTVVMPTVRREDLSVPFVSPEGGERGAAPAAAMSVLGEGAAGGAAGGADWFPESGLAEGNASGRQGRDRLVPVPPAAAQERDAGLHMADGRLDKAESPALPGRDSGAAEMQVAGPALAMPGKAVEVSLGGAEVSGHTQARVSPMLQGAGPVNSTRPGGEGHVVVQHAEALAPAEPGPPPPAAGARAGKFVADADGNPPAGATVLQIRQEVTPRRGAEAAPEAPVLTVAMASVFPAALEAPSRATALAAPDTVLATDGSPSFGQGSPLDAEARPGTDAGPDRTQAAAEAEWIWLGRLLQEDVSDTGRADRRETGATMPTTAGNGPNPYSLAVPSRMQPGWPVFAGGLAGLSLLDMVEPSPGDGDLVPFAIATSAQPAFAVAPTAGALPAGTVAHLGSAIVASLQRRSDGQTEIALSPQELGSVRLRLEPDAQDPDRMIVHLAFDRPETMDLFRRHADQLTEAIRAAGYAEARLDFAQHGTGGEAGAGQDEAHRRGVTAGEAETGPAASQAVPNPGSPLRSGSPTGLDLRL